MRKRHLVSLLLILAACAFVLASGRSHSDDPVHHEQAARPNHGNHAHVAMTDILHHAENHLDHATTHEHSFGSAPAWMADWELRWLDAHHGDHRVRIYHATHTHHPHVRYIVVVDPEHHHTGGWIPVH